MNKTYSQDIKIYNKYHSIDSDIEFVSPIEFLSDEQNKYVLQTVKTRLKDDDNPDKWMTLEECKKLVKEIFH